jgi:putative pyruvate formate lyase activating enzyme
MAAWAGGSIFFSRCANAKTNQPLFEPSYIKLHQSGELKKRGERLWNMMEQCTLCPRECGAQRLKGEEGFCHASSQLEVSSSQPHHGEERPLSGSKGSGTIFFTNCNLRCVFCINWQINHKGIGKPRNLESLAKMMIKLQQIGCHNINLVTPTHYSPHIVLAVDKAVDMGLKLPLVYNTSGWERLEVLKILDGIVDIYLPDFKYWDGKMSDKYSSGAASYPAITKTALLEMHRQVGVGKPEADGLMDRGLMIRHLVLPNRISGTRDIIRWIARNLSKDTYVNLMSQYRPVFKAHNYPGIARRITRKEYSEVLAWAKEAGLTNLDIQGYHFLRN